MSAELDQLKQQLSKQSTFDLDKASRYLRVVRELRVHDPEGVLRYGAMLLKARGRHSEEEWWLLHEQVAAAALCLGNIQYAAGLIRAVAKRFPDSQRADRLKGMYWEAQGKYAEAVQIYNDMISKQPSSETGYKRLVAVEKSRGNLTAAADGLRKYLDIWSNDREGWEELADLHLQTCSYRQALFCYEELLTMAPQHTPYLIRYGDILYTMGGPSNLRVARSYYSKALELTRGTSCRALWGIAACCANATDKVVLQDSLTRALIELPGLTADALMQQYQQHAPSKQNLVQEVLADLAQ